MSEFLDSLVVKEISDSIFQTVDVFRYRSDLAGLITVPSGFYTDFSSVPRFLPAVYALLGDTAHAPAVVHDWLYFSAILSRKMSDDVMFEAMGVIGLPWWRRYPIWWGLRIGGWAAWNDHRKRGYPQGGKFKNSPDIKAL